LTNSPLCPSARSRSHALLVEPTRSIQPQHDTAGPRHAARAVALLSAAACCAALLSAVSVTLADKASASPPPPAPYTATTNALDSMSRTVSSGLGTANQGGTYATTPSAQFSVSGGAGHVAAIASGQGVQATLAVSAADQILYSTFTVPTLPTSGGGVYYDLDLRRQANGDQYSVRVLVAPGGVLTLSAIQIRSGVQTAVGTALVLTQRATAGATIALQAMVSGSTSTELRARAWLTAAAAPDWQFLATDSATTRLSAAGQIGLSAYVSSTSEATALTVTSVVGWSVAFTQSVPPPVPSGQPGPSNTGVPLGTPMTQYTGNMVVTTPGVTLSGMDLHGMLTIRAANVTIKNSIIRGAAITSGNPGIVTDTDPAGTNFVLQDSEVVPEYPSVALDGVRGANYTLTRVNVHGTVDGAKVIGDNVTIQNSWLHDTVYYAVDPYQGGQHTHNDGVQVLNGAKIRLLNNTITNNYNSALQVTQGNGVVSDIWFNGNWADGGGCSVNINSTPLAALSAVVVNDNRFGHATRVLNCPVVVSTSTQLTAQRNVYDDTGAAVVIKYG
jgi:hypothetical protein